jgi:nucleotidyltransferase substrate binding protein (TIGR01987 family)
MDSNQLDLSPLNRAIDRLDEGLARYRREIGDLQIRDGLIQRFEFTYEISHKMLKRYLTLTSPSPTQYNEMAFQDLIRTGNEQGLLLGAWPDWKRYRDMRSKTSHTYDEDIALEVVSGIPAFLAEARHLRDQIKARLTGNTLV